MKNEALEIIRGLFWGFLQLVTLIGLSSFLVYIVYLIYIWLSMAIRI